MLELSLAHFPRALVSASLLARLSHASARSLAIRDLCARHSRAAASPTPTAPRMRVHCTHPGLHAPSAPRVSAPPSSPRPPSHRALSEPLPDLWAEPPRSLRAFRRYSLRDHWAPTPPPHERELACTSTHVLALALARHSRVLALALAKHPRVLGVLLARIQKTLACDSLLTREWSPRYSREFVTLPLSCTVYVHVHVAIYYCKGLSCICIHDDYLFNTYYTPMTYYKPPCNVIVLWLTN